MKIEIKCGKKFQNEQGELFLKTILEQNWPKIEEDWTKSNQREFKIKAKLRETESKIQILEKIKSNSYLAQFLFRRKKSSNKFETRVLFFDILTRKVL